ncbi:hypothetical protein ACFFU9_01985 [Mariniflexile ostreae]|uniref:Secreted protein (Por secretion system target) n=1 Tax=Mariniflexile ostreae TaxID=1520892 RepID=A0ABV5F7T3_9FLAO
MKTIKTIMVMVVLMTASMSYANEPSALLVKKGNKETALVIENVVKGEFVSIKDDLGFALYNEVIMSTGNYSKDFDLAELPNGDYFFELYGYNKIEIIPFSVNKNNVVFDKEKESIIHMPATALENNVLSISKISKNLEPLKIELFYEGASGVYELINSEIIKDANPAERVYELSELQKGQYKIIYTISGRVFVKHINF